MKSKKFILKQTHLVHKASLFSLNFRLKKLINQSKVMLFMKGSIKEPRCGFSRQIVEILNSTE